MDKGIPVATTNSFDPAIYERNAISHTGQSSDAAAIGGEALAKCLIDKGVEGGSIVFPSTTTLGNVEVNRRVTAAFEATVKTLNDAGKLANFKIDAGPENIGIDVNKDDIVNSIVSLIESRGDVVGAFAANAFVTPALGDAVTQIGKAGEICAFRLRPRAEAAGADPLRRAYRRARAAALPAGLLAGDAALPDDRPRRRGAPISTPRRSWSPRRRSTPSASASRTRTRVRWTPPPLRGRGNREAAG
jgi:hypothetical protein